MVGGIVDHHHLISFLLLQKSLVELQVIVGNFFLICRLMMSLIINVCCIIFEITPGKLI
jgi:hypothetical protein